MMDIKEEFKRELKALLTKYDMIISFDVGEGSDTYGIYGEKLIFSHRDRTRFESEDWLTVNGWTVDASDI